MTEASLTPSVILHCKISGRIDDSFVRGQVTVTVNDSVYTRTRNALETVKCASICVFKEMNLDMMILARCATGHSYVNPTERVLSVLNLALQNVVLERKESAEKINKILKSCNSMADVRNFAEKTPEVKMLGKNQLSQLHQCSVTVS